MKMKKLRKRRYLAMLLVFVLCMGMLDISAFAAAPGENIAAGAEQKAGSGQEADGGQTTGDTQTSGDSQTGGDAQTSEESQTGGDTQMSGGSQTGGDVQRSEGSQTGGDVQTSEGSQTGGDAQTSGGSQTGGDVQTSGGSQTDGDVQTSGGSQTGGDVQTSGGSQTGGDVQTSGDSQTSENIQNTGAGPEENVNTETGGDTESEGNQEETAIPENAAAEDFWAAVEEMGETDDEDSVRATIEKILSIYGRLSEEDKADEAVQKAYEELKAYAENLGQDEIELLDEDETYTVIYQDSGEYGGEVFQKTEGLKEGESTPGYSDKWFAERDRDFKMWSPTWENTVGGENYTITYTAVYKEKQTYPFTIFYEWSGAAEDVKKAANNYTDILSRGDSYSVSSPTLDVPFEYAVNFPVIEGTVGYTTSDIKYWVTYTPKVKIQHVYRVNGEVVGTVDDTTVKELPFGRTLTGVPYRVTIKPSYSGKIYTYTSTNTVTLPNDPSQLTEQPVLKLYYDRTEKETHNVIIHYKWAGTDVKAAEDQINSFEEGEFYLVNSPAGITTAPFVNIITDSNQMTISGIMGTEDIERTVYYAPKLNMKYILQENGEDKYSGPYQVNWTGEFGKSYTYNYYKVGDSFNANDPVWGQYYFTKVVNAVIPANPADLKTTPVITLYFNKTIPTTLTVIKTADKETAGPGDEVKYTIIVENTGTVVAKDVKITDVLDSNLKFVESTIEGSENVYTIGDIPVNDSRTLEITAKVSDDAADGTVIINEATASYTNKPENTPDPSGRAEVTVTDTPDDEQVTITLKYVYVDENGSETELRDDMEVQVKKGEEYDVSERAFETIAKDGLSYRRDSVDGDLTGTAAENRTITVKYVIVEETPENPTEPENPTPPTPPVTPPGGGGGRTPDPTPELPAPGPGPVIPTPAEPVPDEPVPAAVTSNVTPVTPTVVAAAEPEEQETVTAEIGEERVPLADGNEPEIRQTAEVEEEEVPLAGGEGGSWALFNFALMNLAIFESIMLLIGYFVRTKNDEDERKLKKKGLFRMISLPVAVISLVVFVLTENIHLQTALVDKYTVVMLLIAVVQTVMVVLSNKKYEEEQEAK